MSYNLYTNTELSNNVTILKSKFQLINMIHENYESELKTLLYNILYEMNNINYVEIIMQPDHIFSLIKINNIWYLISS